MKPWKPTHTDYYNCTSKVSKAAADHRRFADYNQRCTSHHKSKVSNVQYIMVDGILMIRNMFILKDVCREVVPSGQGHQ